VARADNKTTDKSVAGISCRLNVDQYDCLNNKLTEIALQLERLQTAVNNLDISASTKTVAGRNTVWSGDRVAYTPLIKFLSQEFACTGVWNETRQLFYSCCYLFYEYLAYFVILHTTNSIGAYESKQSKLN